MRTNALLAFAVSLALHGCHTLRADPDQAGTSGPDLLVGCYAQSKDGPATLQVEREGAEYFLVSLTESQSRARWLHLTPLSDTQLAKIPVEDGRKVKAVLRGRLGVMAVFKFETSDAAGDRAGSESFYFYAPQVGGPIFRRTCSRMAGGA